ncbi:MAG: hypothetical protein K6G15_08460 [Desulfovibrio sp.]|nr:hypothetical protein [Desulfovibrio sp.]
MLHIIEQNIFRICGTTANAKIREILANISKIKAYTRVDKTIDFPLDLKEEGLEKPDRSITRLEKALLELHTPEIFLKNSLFWFYNITSNQEKAALYLSQDNFKKARDFYKKDDDFGSIISLSTLLLLKNNRKLAIKTINKLFLNKEIQNNFLDYLSNINGVYFTFNELDLLYTYLDMLSLDIKPEIISKIYRELYSLHPDNNIFTEALERLSSNNKHITYKDTIKLIENIKTQELSTLNLAESEDTLKSIKQKMRKINKYFSNKSREYISICDKIADALYILGNKIIKEEKNDKQMLLYAFDLFNTGYNYCKSPIMQNKFEEKIDKVDDLLQRLEQEDSK